jgi:general secretion pathway protein K
MATALTSPKRKLRRKLRAKERGAALIMVLGSLTILAVMLAEYQDEMSTEFASALSDRDALKAEYAARSAINLSRLLIASEPTVRAAAGLLMSMMGGGKAPQIPVWAFAPQMLGAFNDAEGAGAFKSLAGLDIAQGEGLGFDGAGFEVQIVDEDAKIGLNNAGRSTFGARDVGRQLLGLIGGPQYDPMFERRSDDGEYSNRQDVCSALIDWVDANQDLENCDPNAQGATSSPPEDSYYRNLPDPYSRKNAAFDSLEELHMVHGVGDDFWATFIDPDPSDPSQRPVSVWSSGKININTTGPRTLLSYICAHADPADPGYLLCNDPTGVKPQSFLTMMSLAQGMFSGIPVFRSPAKLREALQGKGDFASFFETAGLQPIKFLSDREFDKGLSLESKVFSIYAEGHVRQGKRETHVRLLAVVDFRKAPTVQDLLSQVSAGPAPGTPAPPTPDDGTTTDDDTTGISGAMVPSTAGRVVYFRVN